MPVALVPYLVFATACQRPAPPTRDVLSLTSEQLHLLLPQARIFFFDRDNDSHWDHLFIDRDGDGHPETAIINEDQTDGRPEEQWEDRDGDHQWDWMLGDTDKKNGFDAGRRDTDKNGYFDQQWQDTNADGLPQDAEWKPLAVPEEVPDQRLLARRKLS